MNFPVYSAFRPWMCPCCHSWNQEVLVTEATVKGWCASDECANWRAEWHDSEPELIPERDLNLSLSERAGAAILRAWILELAKNVRADARLPDLERR